MIPRSADDSPDQLATVPLSLPCRAAQSAVGITSLCPSDKMVMKTRCLMPRGFCSLLHRLRLFVSVISGGQVSSGIRNMLFVSVSTKRPWKALAQRLTQELLLPLLNVIQKPVWSRTIFRVEN